MPELNCILCTIIALSTAYSSWEAAKLNSSEKIIKWESKPINEPLFPEPGPKSFFFIFVCDYIVLKGTVGFRPWWDSLEDCMLSTMLAIGKHVLVR